MRIRAIFFRTLGVISTTFLVACGAQVPECHDAAVLDVVKGLFVKAYDKPVLPNTRLENLASFSVDVPAAVRLDKDISTRFCKATFTVTLDAAKVKQAAEYHDFLVEVRYQRQLNGFERETLEVMKAGMEFKLIDLLKDPTISFPIQYQVQLQGKEFQVLTNVHAPVNLVEMMSRAEFAKVMAAAQAKKDAQAAAEQPDQRLVMVNSTAMCTDEALCVDTTKGEFRVNAFGLSEREKQLLTSRTAICLRGVSKEGDFQYFENVTPSCGR